MVHGMFPLPDVIIVPEQRDPGTRFALPRSEENEVLSGTVLPPEHWVASRRTSFEAVKRLVDIVVAGLVILFILSWLIPLIGLLIKLDSRGPVFFVQRRSGLYGKPFYCIKFRSMIVNPESDTMPASGNDPRITPTGRFLRHYFIDEVPQFINVLTGTMSIVGPRPHMVLENKRYEELIERYPLRYRVKPGITGPGQILETPGVTGLEKMKRRTYWDLWYIRHRNSRIDVRMVFKTVGYLADRRRHS